MFCNLLRCFSFLVGIPTFLELKDLINLEQQRKDLSNSSKQGRWVLKNTQRLH